VHHERAIAEHLLGSELHVRKGAAQHGEELFVALLPVRLGFRRWRMPHVILGNELVDRLEPSLIPDFVDESTNESFVLHGENLPALCGALFQCVL
jgi:hypothetical protein